ncbi:MAG TPA: hypothetical protein VNT55_18625, partial [Baekduia sp.]|nr:hypothetical protein [Baekduia sp.]
VLLMPGNKRRARLITDWTIGLFFGRDASELGGLGRAPGLGADLTGGGTPAEGAATPNGAAAPTEPVAPS